MWAGAEIYFLPICFSANLHSLLICEILRFVSGSAGAGSSEFARMAPVARVVRTTPGAGSEQEEQRHAEHGYAGAEHAARGDGLPEKQVRREDDDDRGEGHERACDAGAGVLHGQQGAAYADEGAEDGGERGYGEAFPVGEAGAQGGVPFLEPHQNGETDDSGHAAEEVGEKWQHPR